MARLLTAGAESNDLDTTSSTDAQSASIEGVNRLGTGASVVSNIVRSGAFAYKLDQTVAQAGLQIVQTLAASTTYFFRVYGTWTTLPSSRDLVIQVGNGSDGVSIRLTNIGTFQLFLDSTASQAGGDSNAIAANDGWHRIELKVVLNGSTQITTYEMSVDGTIFATASHPGITFTQTNVIGGNSGQGAVWYVDDIAINDSTGGSQNSYPGDGKVVLLLPVTDSATGTGWTLGTGTAAGTAVHTAVANKPPLGVADLAVGSDVKQVRNATSNANSNVDQNMTTYLAAGIEATDTINVIDPVVATGAPVVTSAKAGTVGVASNPTIANVALGAGGTAGAFWSGIAAGTYRTGWKVSHGTPTYAPAVTVGTAPVMRVTQVTSSTRIAIVSFMGLLVDYTSGPPRPYLSVMPSFLAQ